MGRRKKTKNHPSVVDTETPQEVLSIKIPELTKAEKEAMTAGEVCEAYFRCRMNIIEARRLLDKLGFTPLQGNTMLDITAQRSIKKVS